MRRIPDFTRPEWHRAHDDDYLQHSIREGKGMMPSKKDQLRGGSEATPQAIRVVIRPSIAVSHAINYRA